MNDKKNCTKAEEKWYTIIEYYNKSKYLPTKYIKNYCKYFSNTPQNANIERTLKLLQLKYIMK